MAVKIHAPLDNGHQPFKRMATLGPGPKKRVIKSKEKYVCAKGAPYVQLCIIVDGPGKGRTFKVKTNPQTKKKYNKLYAKERKRAAASNDYRAGFKLKASAKMTAAGKASRVQPSRRPAVQIRLKKRK